MALQSSTATRTQLAADIDSNEIGMIICFGRPGTSAGFDSRYSVAMSIFSNPSSSTPAEIQTYVTGLLGLLGDRDPVQVLAETPAAVLRFLDALSPSVVVRAEAPGKWSIRDVVQHMADSELVGGFRLRMVLAHDRPRLTGYDQDLWADRLEYGTVDVRESLDQFTVLRRSNVRIWGRLTPADLVRVGIHGERGEESLDRMRKLYAGHDLLHLAQLERIRAAAM